MSKILKRAGRLQMLALVLFLIEAAVAGVCIMLENYPVAAADVGLMFVCAWMYRVNSKIIEGEVRYGR